MNRAGNRAGNLGEDPVVPNPIVAVQNPYWLYVPRAGVVVPSNAPPSVRSLRVTQSGDPRITQLGDYRITQQEI